MSFKIIPKSYNFHICTHQKEIRTVIFVLFSVVCHTWWLLWQLLTISRTWNCLVIEYFYVQLKILSKRREMFVKVYGLLYIWSTSSTMTLVNIAQRPCTMLRKVFLFKQSDTKFHISNNLKWQRPAGLRPLHHPQIWM